MGLDKKDFDDLRLSRPVSVLEMKKQEDRKLKKIRSAILIYLDRTGWTWDPHLSNLLCQVDSLLFGRNRVFNE